MGVEAHKAFLKKLGQLDRLRTELPESAEPLVPRHWGELTTITLAFMLNAYSVTYIPIEYHKRKGDSKVRYVRDTLRSAQIIVEAIATYNPLKIFLLIAAAVFVSGIAAGILAVWHPWIAFLFFLTVASGMGLFAFGLAVVSLKNRSVNA